MCGHGKPLLQQWVRRVRCGPCSKGGHALQLLRYCCVPCQPWDPAVMQQYGQGVHVPAATRACPFVRDWLALVLGMHSLAHRPCSHSFFEID